MEIQEDLIEKSQLLKEQEKEKEEILPKVRYIFVFNLQILREVVVFKSPARTSPTALSRSSTGWRGPGDNSTESLKKWGFKFKFLFSGKKRPVLFRFQGEHGVLQVLAGHQVLGRVPDWGKATVVILC